MNVLEVSHGIRSKCLGLQVAIQDIETNYSYRGLPRIVKTSDDKVSKIFSIRRARYINEKV